MPEPMSPQPRTPTLLIEDSGMQINKVGVLGCGLMGSGIAQVAATAGFDVTVLEVEQKYLDKGFAGIDKSLTKFAERPPEKVAIPHQTKVNNPRAPSAG